MAVMDARSTEPTGTQEDWTAAGLEAVEYELETEEALEWALAVAHAAALHGVSGWDG